MQIYWITELNLLTKEHKVSSLIVGVDLSIPLETSTSEQIEVFFEDGPTIFLE